MVDTKVFKMELPRPVYVERAYTLPKSVSAIQILPTEDGERTRLGLITQLPAGAEIEIGGPGFSDRTVCIRCFGASYFVFLDDLEAVKMHVAVAHA
jgi:hypothetical protein